MAQVYWYLLFNLIRIQCEGIKVINGWHCPCWVSVGYRVSLGSYGSAAARCLITHRFIWQQAKGGCSGIKMKGINLSSGYDKQERTLKGPVWAAWLVLSLGVFLFNTMVGWRALEARANAIIGQRRCKLLKSSLKDLADPQNSTPSSRKQTT